MERLIETVRKYPCLWKLDSEEYKLIDLKEAAWIEVAKECDLANVAEARSMWKKLRDGHRQAISKKKTVSGQAATSNHQWKYEKQMQFLLPSMQNRQRFTNISSSSNQNSDQGEPRFTEDSCDSEIDYSYGGTTRPKKKPTLISVMEKEQRMRAERSAQRYDLRKEILLSCKEMPKQATALETFFSSMCMTTQTLPERLQLKVQRQLFNLVMEAKEEHNIMTQSRNSSEISSTDVYSFRGNSPLHVSKASTSHSRSAMANYSPTDPLHITSQSYIISETIPESQQQNISEDEPSMYNIRNFLEHSTFE